jgi:ketosteroid isomerase-like protein
MKKLGITLIVALIALAASSAVFAQQSGSDSEAIKTKLKQMEDDWVKAQMDKDHGVGVIGGMVAADFAGFSEKGEMVDKAKLLDSLKTNPDTLATSKNGDMQVKIYDKDLATVTGTTSDTGTDKDGKAFNRSYVWVDTWMKRNGKWEIIGEGVMILPANK